MKDVEEDGLELPRARQHLTRRLLRGGYVGDWAEGMSYARYFVVTPATAKNDLARARAADRRGLRAGLASSASAALCPPAAPALDGAAFVVAASFGSPASSSWMGRGEDALFAIACDRAPRMKDSSSNLSTATKGVPVVKPAQTAPSHIQAGTSRVSPGCSSTIRTSTPSRGAPRRAASRRPCNGCQGYSIRTDRKEYAE